MRRRGRHHGWPSPCRNVPGALRTTPRRNLADGREPCRFGSARVVGYIFLDAEHSSGRYGSTGICARVSQAVRKREAGADVVALCDTHGGMCRDARRGVQEVAASVSGSAASTPQRHLVRGANSLAAVDAAPRTWKGPPTGYGEGGGNADCRGGRRTRSSWPGRGLQEGAMARASGVSNAIAGWPTCARRPQAWVAAVLCAPGRAARVRAEGRPRPLIRHTTRHCGNGLRVLVSELPARARSS